MNKIQQTDAMEHGECHERLYPELRGPQRTWQEGQAVLEPIGDASWETRAQETQKGRKRGTNQVKAGGVF